MDALSVAEVIARLVGEGLMEEMQHASASPPAVVEDPIGFWFRMTPRGRIIWEAEGGYWRALWDARQRAIDEAAEAYCSSSNAKSSRGNGSFDPFQSARISPGWDLIAPSCPVIT
ncbi:MAG: hypothetical protein IRY99_07285 [Isosphaeraceae bacterium]|nr:hypothetical protein [Isosphaeraceae bacterium]